MPLNVALISSPQYCEYIQKLERDLSLSYTLHYIVNTRSAQLPELFDSVQDRYDAFCTTGPAPEQIILRTHPDCTKPVIAITESASEFYRVLLKLLYEDRSCDFSRILFDDSLWNKDQQLVTALDYVHGFQEYNEEKSLETIKLLKLEHLLNAEDIITKRALQLQEQGRLKMVVCRHSQAYSVLREAGVPCILAYPSPSNVYSSLRRLEDTLALIRMEEGLPAVICISSPDLRSAGPEDITVPGVDLQKCLLDFDQENTTGMLIKRSGSGFELYTTRYMVRRLTRQFTRCVLRARITGQLGQQVEIGYGIGRDLMSARDRAFAAVKRSQKDGESYLLDEAGALHKLLLSEERQQAEDVQLQEISARAGLSTITLQRIRSAMELLGSQEITTHELAKALQVTVANANRFINQLQAAGYAIVVAEKKAAARGRPARVYRVSV